MFICSISHPLKALKRAHWLMVDEKRTLKNDSKHFQK